jgi:hypothetical protein
MHIEALDIFKSHPQKPHPRNLSQQKLFQLINSSQCRIPRPRSQSRTRRARTKVTALCPHGQDLTAKLLRNILLSRNTGQD